VKSKIDIKQKYTQEKLPFRSYPKYVNLPYLDAVLRNPLTGEVSGTTNRFKIDTGASISVINSWYQSFIQNMTPFDHIPIQYGNGPIITFPVYNVGIIAKGQEFNICVAYDENCSYSLLGIFGCLEDNTYTIFDSNLRFARLIRT
jgi:hypothetical protein